jgi:hypothetical protein
MQSFVIALLFWATLLCPLNSFAENVCWDEATAGRMVVALEQKNICEQQLTVQLGSNAELQQQKDILLETTKLKDEQLIIYKNMVDMQTKLSEAKDKLHAEELKAAKPTFMQELGKYAIGAAGGAGILLLIIVLL